VSSFSAKNARNFKIFVTNHFDAYDVYKYRNNFTLCAEQGNNPMIPGEVKAYRCPYPKLGQYVVIIKHPVLEDLELCEVEVYDTNVFGEYQLLIYKTASSRIQKPICARISSIIS
jgi:hypothetical protein